jgi:Carbohydrate-binding module 48 (Isoamylase N-terminal domain)
MIRCRVYLSIALSSIAIFPVVALAASRDVAVCTPAGTPASWRISVPPLVSPEVSLDGEVKLHLCAPNASSVAVLGDWKSKSPSGDSLTKDAKGVWSISVSQLQPDFYNYFFLVDGVKTIDPNNVHSSNDALRIGSYFIVPGPGAMSSLYENKEVPHGEVTGLWYASKSVATPRRALVYTPPDYRAGTERYPVLYLLSRMGWR